MIAELTHAQSAADGLAARFVAGTLAGDALERFEVHLLECGLCRYEVELGMTLRAAGPPPAVPRGRGRWAWGALGVAAAAVLTIFIARPSSDAARLTPLGALDAPPIYLGIPVRAEERDTRFEMAMQAYQRGDHSRAASELSALRAVVDAPPVHFFLGASALMIGADSLALVAYDAVLAGPESPYHDEARYYRAKAHLRLGRGDRALRDLRLVTDPALRRQADALADSIGAAGIR